MSKLTIQRGAVGGAAGGASLDAITAAAADQAGILNADWNIAWKWAKVTNTEVAMEFTESAAATGGTSSSGVPNQVLAKFSTLAASTMSPLSVYSRGAHVFSVSPTAAQILAADGASANTAYGFASGVSYGMYKVGNVVCLNANNANYFQASASDDFAKARGPSATAPLTGITVSDSGVFWPSAGVLGISCSLIENSRFIAGGWQASKGSADAVSYAINARKARGTVASPTVITTGDDLLTISGYGYVGATNTYQEACKITFDSTGAISDSATGIGGIIRFLVATVGAEPVEVFNVTGTAMVLSGTVRLKGYTVATLPTGVQGDTAFVTDALAPTYMATVAAGGAVVTKVFFDGTNWICA